MAIFNSYVTNYQRVSFPWLSHGQPFSIKIPAIISLVAPPLWLPPPDWDDTAAARAPRSATEVSSPAAAPAWEEMAGEMPGKLCGIRTVGLSLCFAYDGCMISWCSCAYDCGKGCFDYLYVMVMIVVWILVWRIWMITEVQQSIHIHTTIL